MTRPLTLEGPPDLISGWEVATVTWVGCTPGTLIPRTGLLPLSGHWQKANAGELMSVGPSVTFTG